MIRKNQIEEMARDLCECYVDFDTGLIDIKATSVKLFAKGYRKATEVAEEIFAEIEDVLNNIGYFDELDFKALKKKYTESEGEK